MSWKKALPELSPALSSPNPYHVEPTLTMPRPCIWSVAPDVSVHAWPGVNCDVAAWAGAGPRPTRDRAGAAAATRAPTDVRLMRIDIRFPRVVRTVSTML